MDITGREYIYGIAQDKNGAPYIFLIGDLVRCKDCEYSGWNKYSNIDLSYSNQIVCIKKKNK